MKRIVLLLSILLIGSASIFAQQKQFLSTAQSRLVLEGTGQFGTIFKHSTEFLPDVTQFTYNFEASLSVRTFGNKPWQRKLHYPETGVAILHSQFGDDAVFGHGTGIFPHVKFYIKRMKLVDISFRVGTGLAYINKNYHPVNNPINNVIGAKLNNITQLRIGTDFHVTPKMDVVFAANFTHFSNARVQSPNLGINIPAVVLGVRYGVSPKLLRYNSDTIPEPTKRNEYNYKFSVGISDRGIGGPKYPIYVHTLFYSRYTSPGNKIWLGTSFATNIGEYEFIQIQEIVPEKKQRLQASDWSLFIGDELLLGNVGVNFLVGVYLMDKQFQTAPIYAKLGVNHYFYEFGKNQHKLFYGVNLKTHYSVAEFVEIGAGIAF